MSYTVSKFYARRRFRPFRRPGYPQHCLPGRQVLRFAANPGRQLRLRSYLGSTSRAKLSLDRKIRHVRVGRFRSKAATSHCDSPPCSCLQLRDRPPLTSSAVVWGATPVYSWTVASVRRTALAWTCRLGFQCSYGSVLKSIIPVCCWASYDPSRSLVLAPGIIVPQRHSTDREPAFEPGGSRAATSGNRENSRQMPISDSGHCNTCRFAPSSSWRIGWGT